jgi:hypothetical protein
MNPLPEGLPVVFYVIDLLALLFFGVMIMWGLKHKEE